MRDDEKAGKTQPEEPVFNFEEVSLNSNEIGIDKKKEIQQNENQKKMFFVIKQKMLRYWKNK